MKLKTIQETPYHKCFETLSNELRVSILKQLMKSPKTVKQLCKTLNAEQSRISHSLKILKKCKYVDSEIKGKERLYSIKKEITKNIDENLTESNLFEMILKHHEKVCNGQCNRL